MTYNDLIRFMIDQIHDEAILKEIYSIVRYISYNKEAKTPWITYKFLIIPNLEK